MRYLNFRAAAVGAALAAALLVFAPTLTLAQSAPAASAATSAAPAAPSASASAAPSASASAAPSASASAAPSASASTAPSASASAGASPVASTPASPAAVVAASQPVGANAPTEKREPISLFAYLLIALAAIWFLYAIYKIIRLLLRPPAASIMQLPPAETGRGFLSFVMPYLAIACVLALIVGWGKLFLWAATYSDWYTLGVDLFVICAVMAIAAFAATKGSGGPGPAVH